MVEMADGFLTHQTFSMLLGTDGFLYITISFQRTVLEIHTHSFRVFHMHERKPVDFKCDVCDRQIPADLPDDVQMCLHQMLYRWGDPVRTAFPVAEPGLGVPDELTDHKFVRSIHGQFPHDHAGLHHGTISFCKALAGFSFPSPGCLPAFLAVSHQFLDLLVPGLDHGGEQQVSKRGQDCGSDVRPARILRQRYRLEDGRVAVCQPDRKRSSRTGGKPEALRLRLFSWTWRMLCRTEDWNPAEKHDIRRYQHPPASEDAIGYTHTSPYPCSVTLQLKPEPAFASS